MNLDKNIGWCTHTHNIMTGCLNKKLGICNVKACYAQKTAENPYYRKAFPYGFEPHFYWERLDQVAKLRTPAIIFMDSMSDTFGSWWTENQIRQILNIMDSMRGVHWHKYVDLTKNPERLMEMLLHTELPDDQGPRYPPGNFQNVYFGTSVSGLYDMREIHRLDCLKKVHDAGFKVVLSMEPLLYNPVHLLTYGIDWLDWLIVGGQTKPTKEPPVEWLLEIGSRQFPVFVKENTGLQIDDKTNMFPADLLPIAQAWGKA